VRHEKLRDRPRAEKSLPITDLDQSRAVVTGGVR
jgi:hypothetical protein